MFIMESAVHFLKAEQASFHSWHGVSFRSIFKPFQRRISRGRENDDLIDRLKARNQSALDGVDLRSERNFKFLYFSKIQIWINNGLKLRPKSKSSKTCEELIF